MLSKLNRIGIWRNALKVNDQNNDFILTVNHLSAGYTKDQNVIQDISLAVARGEMLGLLGRNGTGKSTLIKAIHGLIQKTQGQVELPIGDYAYIPEMPVLYEELTLWEHLEIVAMSLGMRQQEFTFTTKRLLRRFNMENFQDSFPGSFSKGTRQKVMVMCAMLALPSLYLIDEPFNGLDAIAIRDFLDWLEQEKQRGAGILLSTHVLETAQRICDRFVLMDNGKIVAEGTMEQLQEQAKCRERDLFTIFLELTKG